MDYLAAYLGIGLILSLVVAARDSRKRDTSAALIGILDIRLFLLWPLWLFIASIERSWPPKEETIGSAGAPFCRVGEIGTVALELRPVGKVKLGEQLFDARSDGSIIPEGTTVVVEREELNELVVRKEEPNQPVRQLGPLHGPSV